MTEIKIRNLLIVDARRRKAGSWGPIRQKAGTTNESRDLIEGAEADPNGEDLDLFSVFGGADDE